MWGQLQDHSAGGRELQIAAVVRVKQRILDLTNLWEYIVFMVLPHLRYSYSTLELYVSSTVQIWGYLDFAWGQDPLGYAPGMCETFRITACVGF